MIDLPVNKLRAPLLAAIKSSGRLLLRAPTGSGKSTCVPPMLLDGAGIEGLIVVVQPRRIAARMLARRVAQLRGGRPGGEVGHVVRFESCMGKETRIVYLTDGVLQRWLQDDRQLSEVGAVVFDEFHERRVASDVALARCLDLQEGGRPDLKLIVMSATLEVQGLKDYLQPCEVLEAEGRSFPVEVSYRGAVAHAGARSPRSLGASQRLPVWEQVAQAVAENIQRGDVGHLLIFLPGVHEIRRSIELIERAPWSRGWDVLPLYSGLAPKLQDAAVDSKPGGRPRIIVSTNVAETSLTIDGVRTVIDAGLARVSRYDAVRGIDTLMVEKISRASADQRMGRAGRTAPGRCVRLWSEADQGQRAGFDLPEIKRLDLVEVILPLKSSGVDLISQFRWLDQPDSKAVEVAEKLLLHLGALDELGMITADGKLMASLPLHPRYARMLLVAEKEGCVAEAGFIAAAVQGEGVFARGRDRRAREDFTDASDGSDFEAEWRAFQLARDLNYDPHRCGQNGILARGAREVGKSLQLLERVASRKGLKWNKVNFDAHRAALGRVMLASFSDRLAVRMGEATLACRLVGGRRGKIDSHSAAKEAEAFVATEITEVEGKEVVVYLNRCAAVSLDDLRGLFAEDFHQYEGACYDPVSRRVNLRREVCFRGLVLESKEGGDPPLADAAQLLAERVVAGELKMKCWDLEVERWIARLISLSQWMPEMELPGFDEDDKLMVLEEVCQGAKSYKEIKNRGVMPVLGKWLSAGQKQVLDAYAPLEVVLSNGRKAKVKYSIDGPPSIALKMQLLYDVNELPEIAQGKVKLVVQLLAPNQRPWQVTDDLKGFWQRGYPQMKKDLAGRYPRHEWR